MGIRDRSTATTPRYEVRVMVDGRLHTRTVRWEGEPPTSKRAWQHAATVTRRHAERILDELRHTKPSPRIGVTVGALLDDWLSIRAPHWSPTTVATTRSIIARHLAPAVGSIEVAELRPEHLARLYASMRQHVSPATVRRCHVVIRSALTQAVQWEWISHNPAVKVSPPGEGPSKSVAARPDELAAVTRWVEQHDPMLAVYLRLAATTGARRGEILGLQWDDFDGHTIRVARAVVGSGVVKAPKTGKQRVMSVDAATRRRVDRWHDWLLDSGVDGPWVFPGKYRDRPINPSTITHQLRVAAATVGASTVTTRQLRHYAATQMLAAGIPVHTVAARLGHDRTSTTLDIYGHAVAAHDTVAADLLGRLASGGGKKRGGGSRNTTQTTGR